MDTFFEQIVSVKKTVKDYFAFVGIWFLAGILSLIILVAMGKYLPLAVTLIIFLIYGALKISQMLFIEYEYIVTNGTLDIDKIIAKSSRKRVMSLSIENISSIEKFHKGTKIPEGAYKKVMACSFDAQDAFMVTASMEGKGRQILVFAPDDRIKEGIVKSLPKYIANSAFK